MATLGAPPESLWQVATTAPHAVLMLDYDGTLAPFHDDPAQALPYPGIEPLLNDIGALGGDRLVIVSGRALDDLQALLKLQPAIEWWGSHGRERQHPNGQREIIPITEQAACALAEAELWGDVIKPLGGLLERKPTSVAFHWRALPESDRARARAALAPRLDRLNGRKDLFWHEFDGGLELRVTGVDKGTAVRQVLTETRSSHADDALLAYLGDDMTDEDAFRALGDKGFSILVRDQLRPTAAESWLRPPGELLRFLERWLDLRSRHPGRFDP
ncbi:MAG TPA: trehalose-phosphatase [Candidatus Acidoferrales bacterium]|nr:trehalose-phosphatase [Candidatus Acidoferrales bacterium]